MKVIVTLILVLAVCYILTFFGLLLGCSSPEYGVNFLHGLGRFVSDLTECFVIGISYLIVSTQQYFPICMEKHYFEQLLQTMIESFLLLLNGFAEIFTSPRTLSFALCWIFLYELIYEYNKLKEIIYYIYQPIEIALYSFARFITDIPKVIAFACMMHVLFSLFNNIIINNYEASSRQ